MSQTSKMVREMFGKGDTLRDAGLGTPPSIERFDNILYGSDPDWQLLDVYRPKDAKEKLPVIVSVHGGAWVYGDKERYQYYCMDLAQRGFAVVNFTYRLAPECKFPSALEDTSLVFGWVLENADTYGFDTDNIFAVGDSAGGSYLALFLALCTHPGYAGQFAFQPPAGFVPKAAAFNCAVFKVEKQPGTMDTALMADLMPEKGTDSELECIDATRYVNENFPPLFLMTSDGDFLQSQQPLFIKELMANQVPFQFHYCKGQEEKLGHVFHLNIRMPQAKKLNDAQCAFFSSFIDTPNI